jgi:hypothetical protein
MTKRERKNVEAHFGGIVEGVYEDEVGPSRGSVLVGIVWLIVGLALFFAVLASPVWWLTPFLIGLPFTGFRRV